ncbi:MAG TPA: (2Fe-2S)-binding protein [Pyrinomonadaceae bacterium]|jgi:aerobic-type carbon monoxide dehydrogenase small subunit (CoxS/CutS family)
MARVTALNINGKKTEVDVDSAVSLLSVLRNLLDLTGTKYGCGEGQCGACTVLLDGEPTRSCVTQVGRAAGKQITTIEGLEKDGKLTPLQEAFIKADAMQCAYCTSGMLMSASALLAKTPRPNRDQIVEGMNRNICRCGVYQRIVEAIQIASGQQVAVLEPQVLGPQASPPARCDTEGVSGNRAGEDACGPRTTKL